MKSLIVMGILVLSQASLASSAPIGTIAFSGQIIATEPGQSLTEVTSTTAGYTVTSTVTHRTLATFSTLAAAKAFAAQVSPAAAINP